MANCLQTRDIIQWIGDCAANPILAYVCRLWYEILHGQCIQLYRIGDGRPLTSMLQHMLCFAPTAHHISIEFGEACFGYREDAETCMLSTLAHSLLEGPRHHHLRTLQLSLRVADQHDNVTIPMTIWHPIVRILNLYSTANNSLRELMLHDGGRGMEMAWSMWARAIMRLLPFKRLRTLHVVVDSQRLLFDDRDCLRLVAHDAMFHGVEDFFIRLPTFVAFQWVKEIMHEKAQRPALAISAMRILTVDVSGGRNMMKPSIAEHIFNMGIQICPQLRELNVSAHTNQHDHPQRSIIDESYLSRCIHLHSVRMDVSATRASSQRFAILLHVLLALPVLVNVEIVASDNNIADDGLEMPTKAAEYACKRTLQVCMIDVRDNHVSSMHAARWRDALLSQLDVVRDITIQTNCA